MHILRYSVFILPILLAPLPALADEVERAALTTIDNCEADIVRYCDDVTPGESRVLACLHGCADQVSNECESALREWQMPVWSPKYQSTQIYPTLEEREIGEPSVDEDGEPVTWQRKLPFLAQDVIDLGFDLPNPYGVALIPALIRQDLILDNLAIGINGPPDREIDFVDFGTPSVENSTIQLKLDAWVLPFLNVFATIGAFDGDGVIPLKFEGSDLFPQLCEITPNAPACTRTYSGIAEPRYEGSNISIGLNVAVGWDRFFATLPITYA